VAPGYRRPSLVIDYDERPVVGVRADAVRLCGDAPTMDQLRVFVDRYIEHKDMARGFDIASQVARRKEGDCSEHAVLLAALGRSFGYPSRVVLGLVVLPIGGAFRAFGHAWVEYHDGTRWRVSDAAVPPEAEPRYVPMQILGDESAAFARYMLETPGGIVVVRRVILDPVPTRN
jgi:hypothetical protein